MPRPGCNIQGSLIVYTPLDIGDFNPGPPEYEAGVLSTRCLEFHNMVEYLYHIYKSESVYVCMFKFNSLTP
jgi:hypothetical protein